MPNQTSYVDFVHRVYDDAMQDLKMIGCSREAVDARTKAALDEFLEIANDLDELTRDVPRAWLIK